LGCYLVAASVSRTAYGLGLGFSTLILGVSVRRLGAASRLSALNDQLLSLIVDEVLGRRQFTVWLATLEQARRRSTDAPESEEEEAEEEAEAEEEEEEEDEYYPASW